MAVLGLHCYTRAFSNCSEGYCLAAVFGFLMLGASLAMAQGLQAAWTSVAAVPGLQSTGSVVVAHGLSCFTECGIFLDQGLNPRLLHWQANSLPLSHQGIPKAFSL